MADEWWRPRPDGSRPPANIVPPFRDYYRVEDDDGGRFWLFRDGPYTMRRQRPADGPLVPPRFLRLKGREDMGTLTIRGLDDRSSTG